MIKRVTVALAILFLFSCSSSVLSDEPTVYTPTPTEAFTEIAVVPSIVPRDVPTPKPTPKPTAKPEPKKAEIKAAKPKTQPRSVGGRPYGNKITATATWCAPKGKYCHGWDRAYVGAVSSFTWGDKRYRVKVCEIDNRIPGKHCTYVTVVSFCACRDKKGIDLSVPAMRELHGISLGRIKVTIVRVK